VSSQRFTAFLFEQRAGLEAVEEPVTRAGSARRFKPHGLQAIAMPPGVRAGLSQPAPQPRLEIKTRFTRPDRRPRFPTMAATTHAKSKPTRCWYGRIARPRAAHYKTQTVCPHPWNDRAWAEVGALRRPRCMRLIP